MESVVSTASFWMGMHRVILRLVPFYVDRTLPKLRQILTDTHAGRQGDTCVTSRKDDQPPGDWAEMQ